MTATVDNVGFIGLGVMGSPMAGHLSVAGYQVSVFNRTHHKTMRWLDAYAGSAADTPACLGEKAGCVISCVGNDEDLKEITLGPDGAFSTMRPGSLFIDHSTTSATVAREIATKGAARGIHFVDAPVSGGEVGAQQGQLSVMCGGTVSAFKLAEPFIKYYAKACTLMGGSGAGQLTKMVNQICIAGLLQGLAEGLNFGLTAGLDMDAVIEVISKGAAQSWQLENRGKTMVNDEFDFGFAVELMRKDLGIVLAESARNGSSLPVTNLVDGYYAKLQSLGFHRADTSSLIKLLRKPS